MKRRQRTVLLLLLGVVLIPVLFYTAVEVVTINDTTDLVAEVYRKQLDVVLFSLNQYVTDVVTQWADRIETDISLARSDEIFRISPALREVIIADTSLSRIRNLKTPNGKSPTTQLLQQNKSRIGRLIRYQEASYRKLEPISLEAESDSSRSGLLFVLQNKKTAVFLELDRKFILDNILQRRLTVTSGEDFIIAVVDSASQSIVYSTHPVTPNELALQRQLWLFPEYSLGIRFQGKTIEELSIERSRTNLLLLIVIDLVLILAVILVYRTINKELKLMELKTDFVSNVSHELRTPLSLIRMYAETLEMKRVRSEPKKQEYYRIILQETERLTRLINNILNFSRIERNARQYHFAPTDINTLVQSVLTLYWHQFSSEGIRVSTSFDETIGMIEADEEAIGEALHNLIDNAMKYGSTNKYIGIFTKSDASHIRIAVEDHGVGIPTEFHLKIFEQFYRVSQGLVHTAKGSGLGLSLVRHIVHAHGGTVTVESEPGKGSTFTLILPRTKKG